MLRPATPRSIQRLRTGWLPPYPALWTAVQRLLVLFTVFQLLSWVNYTDTGVFVKDFLDVQTNWI
jgi:hypothetical protein